MKTNARLLITLLLSTFAWLPFSYADLTLDKPEVLIQKASENRQQLRDVIIQIAMQLPEMRDQTTFDSYFKILDQLDELAKNQNLDDIFPNAVKNLGKKMAGFSVKWTDLSSIEQEKLSYYLKWYDLDSYYNLLTITKYIISQFSTDDLQKYQTCALNLENIIVNHFSDFKVRPDLAIGYHETMEQVALKITSSDKLTDDEKEFWYDKIATSNGLNLYLDIVQNNVYALTKETKSNYSNLYTQTLKSFIKYEKLIDAKPRWLLEKASAVSVELMKKSFELNIPVTNEMASNLISKLSPSFLQSLVFTLNQVPENFLADNGASFENIFNVLYPTLNQSNLLTDANNLNIYAGKILAALKIRDLQLEGTYKIKDVKGKYWLFTILNTKPLDLAVGLADSTFIVTKNYFYVRYSPSQKIFIATSSQYDSDSAQSRPMIQFKFDQNTITVMDEFGAAQTKSMIGNAIEKEPTLQFGPKNNTLFSKRFSGKLTIKNSAATQVDFIVQSDGQNITGRLQDKHGSIYDFSNGYLGLDGTLVMNTGRIGQVTWAQFRGKITESGELQGHVVVAGRGQTTNDFILK